MMRGMNDAKLQGQRWEMMEMKYAGHDDIDKVNLDELDLTVHKVLELGVIGEAALQMTGHAGNEDFSDLFDNVGILLRYAAAKMLWEVYKDDDDLERNGMSRETFIKPALELESKEAIISLDSFDWGLVERLVK
jgi:hypothetical protein